MAVRRGGLRACICCGSGRRDRGRHCGRVYDWLALRHKRCVAVIIAGDVVVMLALSTLLLEVTNVSSAVVVVVVVVVVNIITVASVNFPFGVGTARACSTAFSTNTTLKLPNLS